MPQDLILHLWLAPGDTVVMTAAVRDLHLAHPGKYRTDVRTVAHEIWQGNPYVTALNDSAPGVRRIEMHYPLIHQSNTGGYHFIHGFAFHLEEQLGVRVPITQIKGDIYLSEEERSWPRLAAELDIDWDRDFWLIVAGGKPDIRCKWWDPARYQGVVDVFAGCIQFFQCGEAGHWHQPLRGVINLIGKTDSRQFARLMYHAAGVVCPVTFAMHLAAAVPTRLDRLRNRPCVVIGGGREPSQWVKYPHHRYLELNGAMPCCDQGGCWKANCAIGCKDSDACLFPVEISPGLAIPLCMTMVEVDDVCRAIHQYHQGGACRYLRE